MRFMHNSEEVEIERSTSGGGQRVTASASFFQDDKIEALSASGGKLTVTLENWNATLTRRLLPRKRTGSKDYDLRSPTFRELSNYYMRKGKAAFVEPRQVFQG